MIRLPQSYDEGFCSLLERLRSTYPAELFRLEGIHPDQLDINAVSRDYFKTSDRKGSATADHSIDPNANVSGRDVITFNYEVPKSLMKLNSLYNLWKTMKELYGRDDADQAIEYEINGTLYINDVWDIGRPYCFNYSTYDIALEGLKMGGRLNIDPPKSLNAFLRQVEQFTVYAANSTLGATGLADLLIVVSRYVDDILTTGYDHHVKIGKAPRVWTYVKESLTSLIYTLNWEFRGNQSPFTNVSVYDRHFLRQLVPAYLIGGTGPGHRNRGEGAGSLPRRLQRDAGPHPHHLPGGDGLFQRRAGFRRRRAHHSGQSLPQEDRPPQPQIRLHQHLLRGILHPVLVLPPALLHLGSRLQQHLRGGLHQDRQPRRRHPEPPPAGPDIGGRRFPRPSSACCASPRGRPRASTTPSACSSGTASNAAPSRCIRSGSWTFPASIPPAASRGSMRPCPSSASTC